MKSITGSILVFILFLNVNGKAQTLITRAQAYDWNAGDVFEYEGGTAGVNWRRIDTVVSKYYSNNLDSVFYVFNRHSVVYAQCPPPCTNTYSSSIADTVFYTGLTDTIGAGLGIKPSDLFCFDTSGYTGTYLDTIFSDPDRCNAYTTRIMALSNGPFLIDTCFGFFEPYFESAAFATGLGEVEHDYNACANGMPNCHWFSRLIFYKKGNDSCGFRINVMPLGINRFDQQKVISIYPVPAIDKFSVSGITGDYKLMVFDADGRNVMTAIQEKDNAFSIAHLHPGVYTVQIIITQKETLHRKLLIVK